MSTTLCEAKITEDSGSRWLCIRMKHGEDEPDGEEHGGRGHLWAPDSDEIDASAPGGGAAE